MFVIRHATPILVKPTPIESRQTRQSSEPQSALVCNCQSVIRSGVRNEKIDIRKQNRSRPSHANTAYCTLLQSGHSNRPLEDVGARLCETTSHLPIPWFLSALWRQIPGTNQTVEQLNCGGTHIQNNGDHRCIYVYTYPKRDFPEILSKIFESVKTGIEIARKTNNITHMQNRNRLSK